MKSDYRPDIDGLRALAIIPVVAYHAGSPGFGGGFVGVDIFFVISGFLITQLLISEAERTGGVNLAEFYARRMRRLAPAFAVVAIATLIMGMYLLSPLGPRQEMAKSAIAAATFVSNIYFWKTTPGYFAGPTDVLPFLHTWSLAVEEQYYLVWPALTLLAITVARRTRIPFRALVGGVLTAALVIGLSLGVAWTDSEPEAAFFLIPTRMWELAQGGLLACAAPWLSRTSRGVLQAAGVAGIGLIATSIVLLSSTTPFPGVAALVPTMGAFLVLAAGLGQQSTWVGRILASQPLRFIGLVSYSWYLWHWPLFALPKAYFMETLSPVASLVSAAVSFLLAVLTYAYIENPIRQRKSALLATRTRALAGGVTISATVVVAALAVGLAARDEARAPESAKLAAADAEHRFHELCLVGYPFESLPPASECTAGSAPTGPGIILWGDSHSDHLMPLLMQLSDMTPVLERAMSNCPPVLGVTPTFGSKQAVGCDEFNKQVLREVLATAAQRPVVVVLAARWPRYLLREPVTKDERGVRIAIDRTVGDSASAVARMRETLGGTLDRLRAANVNVLLAAPAPELIYPARECIYRKPANECAVARALVEDYRREAMAVLSEAAQRDGVELWDAAPQLCDERQCFAEKDGVILFRDEDHYSVAAAESLLPSLAPALRTFIAQERHE